MRVRVRFPGVEAPTLYKGISAVGIGHIKKDLVLVPDGERPKPVEVGTDWIAITILKEG